MPQSPADIKNLHNQLDAAQRDAVALAEDLAEERAAWRADAGSWSVAQCLDHLAVTNGVYLGAMKEPAIRARAAGRLRRRPALPGFVGRWFANHIEPPVKASSRMKTMQKFKPGTAPLLADALARFLASQDEVRDYIVINSNLDLAGIRFPNPVLPGVRFSVATGTSRHRRTRKAPLMASRGRFAALRRMLP